MRKFINIFCILLCLFFSVFALADNGKKNVLPACKEAIDPNGDPRSSDTTEWDILWNEYLNARQDMMNCTFCDRKGKFSSPRAKKGGDFCKAKRAAEDAALKKFNNYRDNYNPDREGDCCATNSCIEVVCPR